MILYAVVVGTSMFVSSELAPVCEKKGMRFKIKILFGDSIKTTPLVCELAPQPPAWREKS